MVNGGVLRRVAPGLVPIVVASVLGLVGAHPAAAAPGDITTVAGSLGEGPGTAVAQRPTALAARGTKVYVRSQSKFVIRELDTVTGRQRVVAGNGRQDSGPGVPADGPALRSALGYVSALAVDPHGNVFAADLTRDVVRRIAPDGTMTTVAGNGVAGFSGDGGPARSASLGDVTGLAVGPDASLYLADLANRRVRKVDPDGTIATIAGSGAGGVAGSGDGGPATLAPVLPESVAVAGDGTVYVGDLLGNGGIGGLVRAVSPAGVISTVAGGGSSLPGSGTPARSARLSPYDLTSAPDGSLVIAEESSVSRVDVAGARISIIAGDGSIRLPPDGTGAREADLPMPRAVTVDDAGKVYVGDLRDDKVYRIDAAGTLTTVAGNGNLSLSGDGGPATSAQFSRPDDLAVDGAGNLLVADAANSRIRRVDRAGVITTVAGSGGPDGGSAGDGGPATEAQMQSPTGVAVDAGGSLYILEGSARRVRKVDPSGTISTLAVIPDFSPYPDVLTGIAVDVAGNVFVSQTDEPAVWRVRPSSAPDVYMSPAVSYSDGTGGRFRLTRPRRLSTDAAGSLYIADSRAVLQVRPGGSVTTLGPSMFENPVDVAVGAAGMAYVADGGRVRRLDPAGRLVTVAGTGVIGSSGDGGPATSAELSPSALAVIGASLYVVDAGPETVRRVESAGEVESVGGGASADGARAWGWNGYGQLGDTTLVTRSRPAPAATVRDAMAVAAGSLHTVALRRDGTVWTWGGNGLGQLGTASPADARSPAQVPGLSGVVEVAAGANHTLAVRSNGTVWAWGWNGTGQLGDGTLTDRRVPARVPGLTGVVAVAAGTFHSLALKGDGTVWAWGWNEFGQLGDGTNEHRWTPVAVPGAAEVSSISAGAYHSLAVDWYGTALTWGWNALGQLGDGTITDRRAPVAVVNLGGPTKALTAGLLHSVALGADGRVSTWGWNAFAQLGSGTTVDRRVPARLPNLSGVTRIGAGGAHTLALRTDQTLYAWGWNVLGQLGDGTTADRAAPVQVPGSQGIVTLAGGLAHTVVG